VLNRWFDQIEKWLEYTYVVLAAAACLITFEVIARYAFNAPHTWFDEVAVLSVVLGTLWVCL